MEGNVFLIVGLIVVGMFLVLKVKASVARRIIERYMSEQRIGGIVEKIGMPPLRLWLNNRKGDAWALVRFRDGSYKWARIRRRLFSNKPPVEFFD